MTHFMPPTATQLRQWYARESIQEVLRNLGLPTVMDGNAVVMRGNQVAIAAEWLSAMSDDRIAGVFLSHYGAKYGEALAGFGGSAPMVSVKHVLSPGLSFGYNGPVIDGATMRVRFLEGGPDSGPEAYIVPRTVLDVNSGNVERNEPVALVPLDAIGRWNSVVQAANAANRHIMVRGGEMYVFNGRNYPIQPVNLNDISLSARVRSEFVADINGFLTRRDFYEQRRLPWTRRYILNGPAGTGKTTLARWACTALGLTPLTIDFTDRCIDGRDLTDFMSLARARAPSVVLFDDFEKVLNGENRSGITPHAILTALSGSMDMDGVVVLATSNSTDAFKGPMRRRFDKVIEFENPTKAELLGYMQKLLVRDPVDWNAVGEFMTSYDRIVSYDDARAVICAAANAVVGAGRDGITTDDVVNEIVNATTDRSQSAR